MENRAPEDAILFLWPCQLAPPKDVFSQLEMILSRLVEMWNRPNLVRAVFSRGRCYAPMYLSIPAAMSQSMSLLWDSANVFTPQITNERRGGDKTAARAVRLSGLKDTRTRLNAGHYCFCVNEVRTETLAADFCAYSRQGLSPPDPGSLQLLIEQSDDSTTDGDFARQGGAWRDS